MLNVSDQEIQFFKNDVTQYSELDTQIKELKKKMKPFQDKIKELTKIKQEKQAEVLSFMEANELDMCNIDTASFELKSAKSTKQITKGDVYDRLYKYFSEDTDKTQGLEPEEKAKFVHDYIYIEGREKVINKALKAK
jgi:predicted nuclease with TOPRIM domain|tara:strand:- start:8430 stop:8840 length:411 start_codon:yes stop_codon:yes gene_type:complete